MGIRFAKGHGTQNDFVLVHDPDGELDLTPAQVAGLCDRRGGIGGDGMIRVVRSSAVPTAEREGIPGLGAADWFMDYRNADGSLAQMCGNGIRVFVHYLRQSGLVALADGESIQVDTRAGTKTVRRAGDLYSADLGPWFVVGGQEAAEAGFDATVHLRGDDIGLPGLRLDLGNPHVVVALPTLALLADADLSVAPRVQPRPGQGTNVEVVVPRHHGTADVGHLTMRVHERGVGETRSCGTGAAAAALAARVWGGSQAPDRWVVDVPGGRVDVTVNAAATPVDGSPDGGARAGASGQDGLLGGASVELCGPAVIVATGTFELDDLLDADTAPDGTPTGSAGTLTPASA
jgi:diaminopimelate epimerase